MSNEDYMAGLLEVADRFWKTVNAADPKDCWLWKGGRHQSGYGVMHVRGKQLRAHRIALELSQGRPLENALACHKCDNRPCCNPSHLYAGSYKSNADDRTLRKRGVMGETHPNATLTLEQVREIRALKGKMTLTEAAKIYGVNFSTIRGIQIGKYWRVQNDR